MPTTLEYEERMKSPLFFSLVNLVLAFIIYYNAELGRLLGIQGLPLAISVVWPATGFSLASLLIFGINVWPGIFLGNFSYNMLHLYLNSYTYQKPFFTAFLISLGSLCQALLGNFIARRYCSSGYLYTVRDVFVFLLFAGLLTCLVSSTIGVISLYFFESMMTRAAFFYTWLTFWIGDSMGIFIFTPLLVVWSILKPIAELRKYIWEVVIMAAAFILVTYLTLVANYPMLHLYIPLCMWAAYRFGMHGATVAVFLITLAVIMPASIGFGSYKEILVTSPLIILVSFIEIIVASSLIVAAIVNERELVWRQIQNHNVDLQHAFELREEEIKQKTDEIYVKEKLSSLGLLTSGIAKQVRVPLQRIGVFTKTTIDCLELIKKSFNSIKEQLNPELSSSLETYFGSMDNYLFNIAKYEAQAHRLASAIEEQSVLTSRTRILVKSININVLLNKCLVEATIEGTKRYPDFAFTVIEKFDRNVKMILSLPEDLAHAFTHIINNAIDSMKEKKDKLGSSYSPMIEVGTVDLHDRLEIIIRDNGLGVHEKHLKDYFTSFLEEIDPEEAMHIAEENKRLGLTIAHDIIIHIYKGEILVNSKAGEYLQVTILLPKDTSKAV